MSAQELANLCVLLEKLAETGVEVEAVYYAAFAQGAAACGNAAAFHKMCDAVKESGVTVSR
jgi:hypothetical protein